jgi:hypothetical protein
MRPMQPWDCLAEPRGLGLAPAAGQTLDDSVSDARNILDGFNVAVMMNFDS